MGPNPEGTFTFSLTDQPESSTGDTIYSLIEPMDFVEIRGSAKAYLYSGQGQKLPLIMRGFISDVRRPEAMDTDGPARQIIVQGQDMGMLWNIHGVWTETALQMNVDLLQQFQLQAFLGIIPNQMGVSDFITAVMTKGINARIADMSAFESHQFPQFSADTSVTQGQVLPQVMGSIQGGSFWSILERFADRPWNELWTDDSDTDGPTVVFRPTPYKDISGNWIGGAISPGLIDISDTDIISVSPGRSHKSVANFFWVPPDAGMVWTGNLTTAASLGAALQLELTGQNNNASLYGFRKMEVRSALAPNTLTTYPPDLPPDQQQGASINLNDWYQARAALLQAMNKDNVLFENGTIEMRGDETIRCGRYVRVQRNQFFWKAYATEVSHDISPFGSWTTSIAFERGDGFIQRNKQTTPPMWLEGRRGPYDQAPPPPAKGTPTVTVTESSQGPAS